MVAWKKARRGKRHTMAAARFERHLGTELWMLHEALLDQTYQPGGYMSFTVHEPKRRKISAAPFRDRVVHHALCNVIGPIFEGKFIDDSYANRVGKGTHKALDRCTYFMRRFKYVLPCDVQQFFPAIDHAILKKTLAHTLADNLTLTLCQKIIDSGAGVLQDEYQMRWFESDDLFATARPRGLPIGNLTSQFWANVYLNDLDQFVKHQLKCCGYLRYVDDFLLFADDKATLIEWRLQVIEFLAKLRLTIHETRAQLRPVQQGIPFLGFTVYPEYRRLKQSKGLQYQRRFRRNYDLFRQGIIERKALDNSVRAWVGHVQHGDTWKLRAKLLGVELSG